MQLKKYQTYFYYGTGEDQTQFQRELSFYIDTAVYENLKNKIDVEHSTDIYEWQDLNITPAEAVNLVNKYLGFNLFNNGVKYYFSNPTTDEALTTDVKAATDQMNLFGLSYNKLVQHSGDRTQTETDITFLNGEEPGAWS